MRVAAIAAALSLALMARHGSFTRGPMPQARHEPPLVYSADPADPWNRIFAALFTRNITAFETSEYADAHATAPLPEPLPPYLHLRLSTATFDRYEEGDRAIEPLYPSFITSRGTNYVFADPVRGELIDALKKAAGDSARRPPIDRALMQADLWSTFDALDAVASAPREEAKRQEAARSLTPLLAALIGKLALDDAEIARLPDTYAAARGAMSLPDVFAPGSEWFEIVMSPDRSHDHAVDFRRASRVFVRPRNRPSDEARFLESLRTDSARELSAAVLVMGTLLIDSRGRVVPSPLIGDVQIRSPKLADRGSMPGADVDEFEMSRRQVRLNPARAFVHFPASAPAYLAIAGNDYGFATPARDRQGETAPILSTLRSRCSGCHGPAGDAFMTFSIIPRPAAPPLAVTRLRQPNHARALQVAAAKEERADFKHLIAAAGLPR